MLAIGTESQKEIKSGLFVDQGELGKEFNKWLIRSWSLWGLLSNRMDCR